MSQVDKPAPGRALDINSQQRGPVGLHRAPVVVRGPNRRRLLAAGLAVLGGSARALGMELPLASSLPEHLAGALGQRSPLLVMVSLPGCPFCKVARESYLAPMVRDDGLQIVQVDMLSKQPLRDFKGKGTTHEQQIQVWGVRLAPTVLFFGRDGAEVAERLVGGYLPDFYGAYLEQRLLVARKAVS